MRDVVSPHVLPWTGHSCATLLVLFDSTVRLRFLRVRSEVFSLIVSRRQRSPLPLYRLALCGLPRGLVSLDLLASYLQAASDCIAAGKRASKRAHHGIASQSCRSSTVSRLGSIESPHPELRRLAQRWTYPSRFTDACLSPSQIAASCSLSCLLSGRALCASTGSAARLADSKTDPATPDPTAPASTPKSAPFPIPTRRLQWLQQLQLQLQLRLPFPNELMRR